jgi:hypothetical protein
VIGLSEAEYNPDLFPLAIHLARQGNFSRFLINIIAKSGEEISLELLENSRKKTES